MEEKKNVVGSIRHVPVLFSDYFPIRNLFGIPTTSIQQYAVQYLKNKQKIESKKYK